MTKHLIFADNCQTHPTEGSWLLCMAMNPKYASQGGSRLQAVVSQDMGATWTLIADYAADAGWAYEYEAHVLPLLT